MEDSSLVWIKKDRYYLIPESIMGYPGQIQDIDLDFFLNMNTRKPQDMLVFSVYSKKLIISPILIDALPTDPALSSSTEQASFIYWLNLKGARSSYMAVTLPSLSIKIASMLYIIHIVCMLLQSLISSPSDSFNGLNARRPKSLLKKPQAKYTFEAMTTVLFSVADPWIYLITFI